MSKEGLSAKKLHPVKIKTFARVNPVVDDKTNIVRPRALPPSVMGRFWDTYGPFGWRHPFFYSARGDEGIIYVNQFLVGWCRYSFFCLYQVKTYTPTPLMFVDTQRTIPFLGK